MHKFTVALATWLVICFSTTLAHAWGWKMATDPDDVMNFLNTKAPYSHKITEAEITAVYRDTYIEFIVFYQSDDTASSTGGWGWKKATDPDDVKDFLGGQGSYSTPVKEAKVVAVNKNTYTEYYVFYKKGAARNLTPPKIIMK